MNRVLILIKRFIPKAVFNFLAPIYHWLLAFLAALIYRFPSRGMKVVGITGTSGKTTTAEMLFRIFSEAGFRAATSNGLYFRVLDRTESNLLKMTMPGRFRIQKFLREAKNAGCEYVFLEITSQGITQFRHKFIKFYAAIFTNLSEEHIEAHGGFENYRAAKGELFKDVPIAVLNGNDPNFEYFYKIAPRLRGQAKEKIVFIEGDYPAGLVLKLHGKFNKMNAVAALAFAKREGVRPDVAREALAGMAGIPGRMEYIDPPASGGKDFRVLVDYAFIPKVLESVYKEARSESSGLVCVLGSAGGGRDKWKRPELGNIASRYCRKVFVTNEDPYDEDPMQIINEVAGAHADFEKILDRREAIREALQSARTGEVVVITGKGAEPWIMGPNGTKTAWDDRKVVREELAG